METIPRCCGQLHEAAKRRLHWKRPWYVMALSLSISEINSLFPVLTVIRFMKSCFLFVISYRLDRHLFVIITEDLIAI